MYTQVLALLDERVCSGPIVSDLIYFESSMSFDPKTKYLNQNKKMYYTNYFGHSHRRAVQDSAEALLLIVLEYG